MKYMTTFLFLIGVGGASMAQSVLLEEAKRSFKAVLDAVYDEMGQPDMTAAVAERMDRQIFLRDQRKKPAFHPKVNISWSAYKDGISAMISGEEDGEMVRVRVIWRPYQQLEIIDPDAVLSWD